MRDKVGRKNLTSKQAARLLGVSEASVKRWADGGFSLCGRRRAGTGASGRRTWRLRHEGSMREAAERAARVGDVPPLEESLSQTMFEMLVGGHDEEVASTLVGLYLQGHTVALVADALLCTALHRVGELWRAGEMSVAQEHLATHTALTALQALRAAVRLREPEGAQSAICCGVEDDFHELPVHLAALTVEGLRGLVIMKPRAVHTAASRPRSTPAGRAPRRQRLYVRC